jgi:hypothetical protein
VTLTGADVTRQDAACMSALRAARYALLASVANYMTTLLLGLLKLEMISDLLFLVGLASVVGITVSSIACIFLQVWVSLKRRAR